MNQDLAELLAALFYEHPEHVSSLRVLLRDIEANGLHEVPRYAPLVAAMKAAIATPAIEDRHAITR